MSESTVSSVTQLGATTSDWLPNLGQLRDRVFTVLRDSERAFVLEGDIDYWLNEAYIDLNARLRLKQTEQTGTLSSDGALTLPTDFVEIISLWVGGTKVTFVDDAVFESWSEQGNEPDALLGRVFAGVIETWPAQESEDYTLRYVSRPTMLVIDSDQPTAITPELAVRLVMYARAEAKEKEGEYNEAVDYRNQYLEGIPGRPRVGHRMRPAQVNLIPEPTVFEE